MKKSLFVLCLLLVVFSCKKKDESPDEVIIATPNEYNPYMPLSIGNQWNYNVKLNGSQSNQMEVNLHEFVTIDEKAVFQFIVNGGFSTIQDIVIFWYHNSVTDQWYSLNFFRNDVMESSRSQDIVCEGRKERVTINQETLSSFTVNDSGFNNVIKVDVQSACESFPLKGTYYFAHGVGLIKHDMHDDSGIQSTEIISWEIKPAGAE